MSIRPKYFDGKIILTCNWCKKLFTEDGNKDAHSAKCPHCGSTDYSFNDNSTLHMSTRISVPRKSISK